MRPNNCEHRKSTAELRQIIDSEAMDESEESLCTGVSHDEPDEADTADAHDDESEPMFPDGYLEELRDEWPD